MNVCKVRMMVYDDADPNGGGTLRTSYIYGPTAQEYARVMASNDGGTYRILSVEDVHGYKEGSRRWQKPIWERRKAPTHYFFNEHLSREPLSGGAGPNLVGAPDTGRGQASSGEGLVDWGGSGDRDGDTDGKYGDFRGCD